MTYKTEISKHNSTRTLQQKEKWLTREIHDTVRSHTATLIALRMMALHYITHATTLLPPIITQYNGTSTPNPLSII